MPAALSLDLRRRVLDALEAGASQRQVAERLAEAERKLILAWVRSEPDLTQGRWSSASAPSAAQ